MFLKKKSPSLLDKLNELHWHIVEEGVELQQLVLTNVNQQKVNWNYFDNQLIIKVIF